MKLPLTHLVNGNRFILSSLELRLDYDLNPIFIQETLQHQALDDLLKMLTHCSMDAIQHLKAMKYEIPPRDFESHCQHNYSDLFRMRDRLQRQQQSDVFKALNEQALSFYLHLDNAIAQVIDHLESLGLHTLAPEERLPDHFREARQEILKQQANVFYAKGKAKSLDPELNEMLKDYFYACCETENFTQQALHYAELLVSALLKFISKAGERIAELPLMDRLLRMNFNSAEFYQFYTRYLSHKMEEQAGTKRKLMALNYHYKELKQMLVQPGLALEPNRSNIKSLLLDYIKEEIAFQEKTLEDEQYQQVARSASQTDAGREVDSGSNNKIQLLFTQQVLAIFANTMISLNLIQLGLGGLKEFTNFLANHFTTKNQESIHPESFRRRYTEKHPVASENLIHILEEMIRFIKQGYMGIH
jgi:hypothetical protein